jgi:hypothetical protein
LPFPNPYALAPCVCMPCGHATGPRSTLLGSVLG